MGEIILKAGSLFDTRRPVICHGVNCRGKMASGVAGQIARLFPRVKRDYIEKYDAEGWKLGDFQVVDVVSGPPTLKYVVNMATQDGYGNDGRCYVDYGAVEASLEGVLAWAEASDLGVAMPRIGAGLGGGDWNRIMQILTGVVLNKQVVVEVWTP